MPPGISFCKRRATPSTGKQFQLHGPQINTRVPYQDDFLGNPRPLRLESVQLPRQGRVKRPPFPVARYEWSSIQVHVNQKRHTSDIFFGIVMMTEYPLSVVFSTRSRWFAIFPTFTAHAIARPIPVNRHNTSSSTRKWVTSLTRGTHPYSPKWAL